MSDISQFLGGGVPKWSSGSTYSVDSIVWSPENRLLYVRLVGGGGTTDPSADPTNWALFGASRIKSIQRGTISFQSQDGSKTATVSAVNVAKSELRFLGVRGDIDLPHSLVTLVLTNPTTITATRSKSGTYPVTVSWELTEWW